MQHPEHPKPSPSRPSLLSASASNDADHARILGGTSTGGKKAAPAKPAKKGLVWLLLGGVAITAAWGLISRTGPSTSELDKASSTAPQITAQAPTAAAASAPEPAPSKPAPPAAAIIQDDAPSSTTVAAAKSTGQDPLASALEAGVKVPPNTINSALNATPASPPAKPQQASQSVHRAEPVKVAAERSKPAPAPVGKQADPVDSDVSLISALVAHNEADPQPSPASTQSRPKRPAKQQANQDIVERHAGDNTEALLKRCKRLGGTEAKLCQRRICSGHSNEAACKAK